MANVSRPKPIQKPRKPHKDFPLTPHPSGRWCKKIKGRLHYFGPWSDPEGALAKWLEQKDDLLAGRTPRVHADGLQLRDLLNRFLTSKKHLLESGELSSRTFVDYHRTCDRLAKCFGAKRLVVDLAADDFERLRKSMSETLGPVALGNEIQRVRVVFKHSYEAGIIDRPMRYGPGFKRPTAATLRKERHAKGSRMFEPHEIRAMLEAASQPMNSMLHLGINCGFGNSDVGNLPMSALDLEGGWVNFGRPKTGIMRRIPLWPETVQSIRGWLARRPTPKDPGDERFVFITRVGGCWAKDSSANPISNEIAKLLRSLNLKRPGLGFYTLRHCVETIGGEAKDQVALDAIMGHVRNDMASVYRERISDERLKAVAECVRRWLFDDPNRPWRTDTPRETEM